MLVGVIAVRLWRHPSGGGSVVSSAVGYRLEGSGNDCDEPEEENLIDDPFDLSDNDYIFFRETFLETGAFFFGSFPSCIHYSRSTHPFSLDHTNFLAASTPNNGGPYAISVLKSKEDQCYRALVRSKNVRGSHWFSELSKQSLFTRCREMFGL